MKDLDQLVELTARVLRDTPPPCRLPAAYLFAQTEDNEASVLGAGLELLCGERIEVLRLPGCPAIAGYPGFNHWQAKLVAAGAPPQRIEAVALEVAAGINTKVEAEAAVRLALARGDCALAVVAAPFHQLRAFMTAVRVALAEHTALRLYSFPGLALPWAEQVTHSQGTVSATRAGLIEPELRRIERYTEKGDLIQVHQVLDYLDQRERSIQ